jgi:benzoate transport
MSTSSPKSEQTSLENPQDIIDYSNMSRLQIIAVALCVCLNAMDGFDVLSISFAAPGIAEEWGISRAGLGIVLSMELIGMAIGSVLIGRIADRYGRRPTILYCLIIMAIGMALASTAGSVEILSIYRFVTGLGIGGMLATTNAMVAEYSNLKRRSFCIALMATGYPLGIVLGGSVVSILLGIFDWRSVFIFGALLTACFIPFIWFFLPESISYLNRNRPKDALVKINKILERMKFQTVNALPQETETLNKAGFSKLFSPKFARITILLCIAYFFHIMTFYYVLKWIPKIVVDMGFSPSSAGSVLVWANVGGMLGSVLLGFMTQKFNVRFLVIGAMLIGAVAVWIFGRGYTDLSSLALVAALEGFFINSAVVGLYAIFAIYYPTDIRASGTGFVIGIGRGGAAMGPMAAGFLFESGLSLEVVSICMAAGPVFAVIALLALIAFDSKRSATK